MKLREHTADLTIAATSIAPDGSACFTFRCHGCGDCEDFFVGYGAPKNVVRRMRYLLDRHEGCYQARGAELAEASS